MCRATQQQIRIGQPHPADLIVDKEKCNFELEDTLLKSAEFTLANSTGRSEITEKTNAASCQAQMHRHTLYASHSIQTVHLTWCDASFVELSNSLLALGKVLADHCSILLV